MVSTAIGVMSGTSLDGLDICYAQFEEKDSKWKFKIIKADTIPYSNAWENKLRNAIHLSAEELLELHSDYGFFLGETIKNFITKKSLQKIDLIASHGHTVFHRPSKKFTLQIGDGRAIKIVNQIPVIYDFRSQDVLLGGNGAPLVPIGDHHLFSAYDACINLGGFSNISLLKNGERIAFDICPVNIVLNHFALQLGKKYDEKGNIAQQGTINNIVLEKLNQLPFYQKLHPKSLGIEWCNAEIFPLLNKLSSEDALATITEHAALQISNIFNQFQVKKVLFTGGGSYNNFLIEKITAKTTSEIIIPDSLTIDFKEALIFAFMGVLRQNNINNVLSSTTGSKYDHCTGVIA
ncbi:anhydro-N-acetylmuramic acid kinase [Chryseobacterium sp.]|uniref:anhydro-N-acetylmuramic acid kinase n=1 Tax=Chryseobacterium sp. TaxID=1871047 RepID=UPI00388D7849